MQSRHGSPLTDVECPISDQVLVVVDSRKGDGLLIGGFRGHHVEALQRVNTQFTTLL